MTVYNEIKNTTTFKNSRLTLQWNKIVEKSTEIWRSLCIVDEDSDLRHYAVSAGKYKRFGTV